MDCIHYWLLERPVAGGVTRAKCRKCGEERDFPSDWKPPPGRDRQAVTSRQDEIRRLRDYSQGYL